MKRLQVYFNNGQLKEFDLDKVTSIDVVDEHDNMLIPYEILKVAVDPDTYKKAKKSA